MPTTIERIREKEKSYRNLQGIINTGTFSTDVLRVLAKSQVAEFPQYNFDGYKLCIVGAHVKTKGGIRFEYGDIAICDDERIIEEISPEPYISVWSFRSGNGVLVKRSDVMTL